MTWLADDEVVITAAIVGAEVMREDSPYVPYTAEEIAAEAKRCIDAGAAIIHLHVREPGGAPSQDPQLFQRAVDSIRSRTDAVVQVSTGGAVGMSPAERLGGLTTQPEMASLNCGSVNFGEAIFKNPMPVMRDMARAIAAAGALPELELYEIGHWDNAQQLLHDGDLRPPFHVQFVLGVAGAAGARDSVLRFFARELPAGTHWSVAAVGRHQMPMAALALELGGHVRVGLEDNLYLRRGVLAEGSAPLVERAVQLASERQRRPVPPARLREHLRAQASSAA